MKELHGHLIAEGRKFGIVVSRFNKFVTSKLLDGCLDCLQRHKADPAMIEVVWVPGSFEIPMVARKLVDSGKYDAVICLGAVIRGATPHFDFIAAEVTKGIAQTALQSGVPTVFGVVTADSLEQALERAGTKAGNKGWDAALSAIELADLYGRL